MLAGGDGGPSGNMQCPLWKITSFTQQRYNDDDADDGDDEDGAEQC